MSISSTHTRLTRTSSDLRTLSASPPPPSPILKAEDLLFFSTSGEIPLLLEKLTHDPVLGHKLDCDAWGNAEDLTPENRTCKRTYIHGSTIVDPSGGCHAESSSELCNERRGSTRRVSHHGGDSSRSSVQDDHTLLKIGEQDDFGFGWDPQPSCPNATKLTATADLEDDQLPMLATFYTSSTLPTPTFAPPSPSSSAEVISPSSSPINRQRQRRPLERARAVRFPGRPWSTRLQPNEVDSNLVRDRLVSPDKLASYPRWQLKDSVLTGSSYSGTTDARVSDAAYPFMEHVILPEELSWLKHLAIELWIDQEGFRAVRLCMQLIGYSPRNRSLHPYESAECIGSDGTAGVADFMPTKREIFAFHYATLDGPPTLRMVSLAGDETRDYLSRQATLSVKANGVYSVLGTESLIGSTSNSDTHSGHRPQNARLRWKFDYLVSDRKVDSSGKTLPGEKTLTPLTFSCSPYLFHPFQGKRAGLMHIMKKNLIPKLSSQKLEPPAYPSSHSVLPQVSRHLSTMKDATTHARSHSDASAKSGQYSRARSPLLNGAERENIQSLNHTPRARRRRASSAGESSLATFGNDPKQGSIAVFREMLLYVPGPTLLR